MVSFQCEVSWMKSFFFCALRWSFAGIEEDQPQFNKGINALGSR